MKETWKIIIAIIITAVIVGGAVFLWQQKEKAETSTLPKTEKVNESQNILYSDDLYNLKFVVNKECGNYFSVKEGADYVDESAIKSYSVYAPGSKDWQPNAPLYYYSIYSIDDYNKLKSQPSEQPSDIRLALDADLILVVYPGQDFPDDLPEGCKDVMVEKIK